MRIVEAIITNYIEITIFFIRRKISIATERDKCAFPKHYLWIRWKFIHSYGVLTGVCTVP